MDDFDLDKYQAHIQEIIDRGDGEFRPTQAKNIMKLIGLIRQAEKDAARYRWMRNQANKAITRCPAAAMIDYDGTVLMRQPGIQHLLCGGELDNAIDEAMNA